MILNKNIKFNEFKDVNSNQVLDELSDVIFALNIGQISEIVNTTLAHHIIILDKIDIEKEPMLNDVSEKIKTTLTMVKLDNYFNDLKSNINQKILDGFSIDEKSLLGNKNIKITHRNLNDNSIEGIEFLDKKCFSVQYHPESSPGPHDSRYLFDQFIEYMNHYINSKNE